MLCSCLNLILMPHILPTFPNETVGVETGDYFPVFYSAFARSTQLVEMP